MSFNIIALTETWLNDSVSDSELFPDLYSIVRSDRNFSITGRSKCGGVLVAFSNSVKYPVIDTKHLSN